MWCINCGNQLPDEAKFCMGCGTKVIVPNKPIQEQKIETVQNCSDIELKLHNQVIKLPVEIKEYIYLRNKYQNMAHNASNYIYENYSNKYKGLSGVVKLAEDDIRSVINDALDKSIDLIEEISKHRINEKDFLNSLDDYTIEFEGVLNEYKEKYQEIIEAKESQKEYRDARKNGRGKLIGGGFGVGGAVKGIAMAGTVNAATGMLHSISNAIGNASTDSQAYDAMQSVYEDENLQFELLSAVHNDINNLCYEVINFINNNFNKNIPNYYTERNYNKAMSIFDTIIEANGQMDNVEEKMVEMLFEYPFATKFYEIAIAVCNNKLSYLDNYAEFFGININEIRERINSINENSNKLYSIFGENKDFLETVLKDNIIYNQNKYDLSNDYIKNIETIYSNIKFKQLNYLPQEINDNKVNNKYVSATESYAKFRGENPLFLFDNTSFGSAKDGFIITDKKIYIHNMMENAKNIVIKDIEYINKNYDSSKMYIDDEDIGIDLVEKKERILFKDFIEFVLCMLKCNNSQSLDNSCLEGYYCEDEDEDYDTDDFDIVECVSEYITSIQNDKIKKFLYAINESDIANTKFTNACSSYVNFDTDEEPIVLYDNTAFGGAKDGFILTDESIQFHNMMSKPVKIYYDEIEKIYVKGSDLCINDNIKIFINMIDSRSRKEFEEIIVKIIDIITE